jgi:hypothetical protein
MQTQQTITLFGTVSNSATSRISKNGRKYTAFGVAIISDHHLQAFHYNVVAFGKQGHFAKPLHTGTRIKLVVQAQSQPDRVLAERWRVHFNTARPHPRLRLSIDKISRATLTMKLVQKVGRPFFTTMR